MREGAVSPPALAGGDVKDGSFWAKRSGIEESRWITRKPFSEAPTRFSLLRCAQGASVASRPRNDDDAGIWGQRGASPVDDETRPVAKGKY